MRQEPGRASPANDSGHDYKGRGGSRSVHWGDGFVKIDLELLGRDPVGEGPPRKLLSCMTELELVAYGSEFAFYALPQVGSPIQSPENPLASLLAKRPMVQAAQPSPSFQSGSPGAPQEVYDISSLRFTEDLTKPHRRPWLMARRAIGRAEVAIDRLEALSSRASEIAAGAWTILRSRRGRGTTFEIPRDGTPFVVPPEAWEAQRKALAAAVWVLGTILLVSGALVAWVGIMKRAFPGGLR